MPIVKSKWRAVNVIQTTTNTMRNVAAGKLPLCERFLKTVRPFAAITAPFFEISNEPPADQVKTELNVAICTERGLCGAVGSNVPREVFTKYRAEIQKHEDREHLFAMYGKKGMVKLSGMVPNMLPQVDMGFGNMKMKDPHFGWVCETVDKLNKLEWDVANIVYNTYVNSCVFNVTTKKIYRMDICEQIAEFQLPVYEIEGDELEILPNLREYKMACTIYHALAEQFASEQGSRLQSMEGAVSACKEKSAEYEKIYMKLRQTKITSELTVLAAGVKCLEQADGKED